jgi:hypothetical protein
LLYRDKKVVSVFVPFSCAAYGQLVTFTDFFTQSSSHESSSSHEFELGQMLRILWDAILQLAS